MPRDDYTFGDSELAARRLELLGRTFEQTTANFIAAAAPAEPALAVDLGSGPGHTTMLLRETLHPTLTVAVDFSPAYVEQTAERVGDAAGVEVIEADVLDLPAEIEGAEVIFARMLLTHLRRPLEAIELWRRRLAPEGVLLLEEVESIETDEPALARYLDLQSEMLEANENELEIGTGLDAVLAEDPGLRANAVVVLQPSAAIAARMFGMNFGAWRERAEVTAAHEAAELDSIAAGLGRVATAPEDSRPITWRMRQIVLTP